MKKYKIKKLGNNFFLLILIYILLIINYRFIISEHFNYLGFDKQYFSAFKMLISFNFTFMLIMLYRSIKIEFYRIVYNVYLVIVFFGQSIFYIFNQANFIIVIYMSLPLILQ